MFIYTALLYSGRRRTDVVLYLGAYVASVGYVWLYYGLYRLDALAWAPVLRYSELVFECLAGPFLFLYTIRLIGQDFKYRALHPLLFVPAAAVLAYIVAARPGLALVVEASRGPNPDYFSDPLVKIINTLADIFFFSFILLSTLRTVRAYRRGADRFQRAFRWILAYYLVGSMTIVVFVAGHLARNDAILGLAVLANGLNTTYLFFLGNRYPEYVHRRFAIAPAGGDSKAVSSSVAPAQEPPAAVDRLGGGLDMAQAIARLEKVMVEEGCFRDPGISLQSLSLRLGMQNHQLSAVINKGLGTNFRGYINGRRLEEAKRLLLESPAMSILDIAFSVGFNSKSVFNSAFFKETGLTPSDFRKNTRPKS